MFDAGTLTVVFASLLAGLAGGAHCAGMCGGIAGAIQLKNVSQPIAQPIARNTRPDARPFTRSLLFNFGRITSYTVAGALAGGAAAFVMQDTLLLRQILFTVANLMLIALGLYLAGLWRGVLVLERGGAMLWSGIKPAAARLMKAPSPGSAFALGALWGWIPCGLVYSMLVTSLASGSMANGALIMLAFGLGTLPNLLALGYAVQRAGKWLHKPGVRLAAGFVVVTFGVFGLMRLPALARMHGWAAICHPALVGAT